MFTVQFGKSADENTKEYRDMCGLYNLLVQVVPDPEVTTGADGTKTTLDAHLESIMTSIVKLNLTVLQTAMADVLQAEDQPPTTQKLKENTAPAKEYYKDIDDDIIAMMITNYPQTQPGPKEDKAFIQRYNLPLPGPRRKALQPSFYKMTKAALDLRKDVKNKISQITTLRQEARDAMARALYATDKPSAETLTDPKAKLPGIAPNKFPWTPSTARDTMCATAAADGSKAGKSLATDMVCLCVQHDSAANDFCGTGLSIPTTQITGSSAAATAAAAFDRIAAGCAADSKLHQQQLSGHALTTAVQTIFTNLGKNYLEESSATGAAYAAKDTAFLGRFARGSTTPSACDSTSLNAFGTAGKGVCIGYHDVLKTNKPIPWVKEINIAVGKLNAVSDIFSQATATLAQVKMIEQQMEAFLWIGDLLNPMTGTLPQITTNKQGTVEEQNKCKAVANKTPEECAAKGCAYDNSTKECKPKAGSENTAAESTESTTKEEGTTASGCAKHGTKTECDADKTGDKQNCAWRKGKDGETDEPEKGKCRSLSFLLNKQFALSVVSAAFVALLF
uniref:Variant surface glycoprotein n=1 Tax=Trypanosoma brucei TaxID=5691 RepID=A0A1V0FY91_9TRYP|nr:variant surface glycoprotein [Trypanosoma brucei]